MADRKLSIVCPASLPGYIIGYCIFMVSFTFPDWVSYTAEDPDHAYNFGLWWNCSTEVEEDGMMVRDCRSYDVSDLSASWIICQAFYIVALVLGFVAATIYPKIPVNSTFQFISGVSTLISVIVFVATTSLSDGERLGWAFAIGVVSGAILLINGAVLIVYSKKAGCGMDDVMPIVRGKGQK